MRSELDVLLDKIEEPNLRAALLSQVEHLRARRTFGLVFESHLPVGNGEIQRSKVNC
jgi:hypothetical protein